MSIFIFPTFSAYGLNIKPSDGALLSFFEVGSSTPKASYTTNAETTPHDVPVEADGDGVFPAIYITGLFKITITDKNGANSRTYDNLIGRDGDVIAQGDFDSNTNAGDYPASGSLGDQYHVSEAFTLNAASGSHVLIVGNRIQANKNGATGIDADWDIYKGQILDEDNFASDSATLPPSQQSAKAYIATQITDPEKTKKVNIDSKNLIINVQSNTTVDMDADSLLLLTDAGISTRLGDIDETYDITTDLMAGTTEKASHYYQLWYDALRVRMMVPDLTGAADADVLNSLSVSTATWQTDQVHVDDEIYQTTDGTKGFVKAISSETVITCKDKDGADLDLFPLGTESFIIRMLSPTGLDASKGRFGAANNNSGSDLDDSTYTQIQEEKEYSEAAGDFAVSGQAGFAPGVITILLRQYNDWTGKGSWTTVTKYTFTQTAGALGDITITGLIFKTGIIQTGDLLDANNVSTSYASITNQVSGGDGVISISTGSGTSTSFRSGVEAHLDKKPTFAL